MDQTVDKLAADFNEEMVSTYQRAKVECNYNATRFFQMVNEYGGVKTAKKLLSTRVPSDGFTTLWECGRLDLTLEYAVLKKKFTQLFDDSEREEARNRLTEYGFDFEGQETNLIMKDEASTE